MVTATATNTPTIVPATTPTRSRSFKSTAVRPGRALRWARLLYYAVFAPTFIYSLWVQVVVMKGPGRTPLPASLGFGRDSVFLTFHGNFHCTWYACLCLLNALLDLGTRVRRGKRLRARSRVARLVERITHRWTAILFPLAAFVGIAYYLILHYHPLTRLRATTVPDYDEKMALLHLVPLLFVLGDSLLKDEDSMKRHGLKRSTALIGICTYGVLYFIWSCFCVFKNGGHWPYPVSLFACSFACLSTYSNGHTRFHFCTLFMSCTDRED